MACHNTKSWQCQLMQGQAPRPLGCCCKCLHDALYPLVAAEETAFLLLNSAAWLYAECCQVLPVLPQPLGQVLQPLLCLLLLLLHHAVLVTWEHQLNAAAAEAEVICCHRSPGPADACQQHMGWARRGGGLRANQSLRLPWQLFQVQKGLGVLC
jgi:hypothetical protein